MTGARLVALATAPGLEVSFPPRSPQSARPGPGRMRPGLQSRRSTVVDWCSCSSEVKDEAQGLADRPHPVRTDHPPAQRDALDRDHSQRAYEVWPNQAARAVIQEVHRHHDVRPAKGRFVMTRAAEVNVVDLCMPDQASASDSLRSSTCCSHAAGSPRRH
jgi:hypothetical protein